VPVTARIMVVEDDEDLRDVLASALRRLGHSVIEAKNGYEALELLGRSPRPHIILLDIMMPVMDGRQFMAALDDHGKTIPIIVMTAQPDAAAAVSGTAAVLLKPVGLHNLMTTIARVLRTLVNLDDEAGSPPPVSDAEPLAVGTPPTGVEAQAELAAAIEPGIAAAPATEMVDAPGPDADAAASPGPSGRPG